MSRLVGRLRRADGDAGITLVELLVYSVLSVVVITVVGSLLVRTLVSQRDVRSVTGATTAAQLVAASVEAGVRNAAAVRPPVTLEGADELLVARVAQVDAAGTPGWRCQGWFYDASESTLSTRTTPASAGSAAITAPTTAGHLATWTVLATGVDLAPGVPRAFTHEPGVPAAGVRLDVEVAAGTRKPVRISTRVTQRPQGSTESAPCF